MFTDALSGNVELDDNGVRRKFSLEVLELTFTAHWDTMAVSSESVGQYYLTMLI